MTPQKGKNPDRAQSPLVGIGYDTPRNKEFSKPHTHKRTQVLYCRSGCFQTQVHPYEFMVPPTKAIIIPAHTPHSGRATDAIQYRSLYIDSEHYPSLHQTTTAIHVSPLLKELITKACQCPWDYPENSPDSRLADVIIDELLQAPQETYGLPMTHHATLNTLKDFLLTHLNEKINADELARRFAMSSKTLSRLCKKELGMTLEAWRQQIKLIKAIELLSLNTSTTATAQALGYHTDSAFIYQFKKLTGRTPSEFHVKPESKNSLL